MLNGYFINLKELTLTGPKPERIFTSARYKFWLSFLLTFFENLSWLIEKLIELFASLTISLNQFVNFLFILLILS